MMCSGAENALFPAPLQGGQPSVPPKIMAGVWLNPSPTETKWEPLMESVFATRDTRELCVRVRTCYWGEGGGGGGADMKSNKYLIYVKEFHLKITELWAIMFGICNSPLPPQKCWWKVLVMTKWHVQITNCVIIFSLYWFFFYFSPDLWSEWIRGNRKGDHERRGGVSFGRDRRLRPVAARSGCLWRSPCPGLGTPHWVQVYLCNCYINKKYNKNYVFKQNTVLCHFKR